MLQQPILQSMPAIGVPNNFFRHFCEAPHCIAFHRDKPDFFAAFFIKKKSRQRLKTGKVSPVY